MAMGRYDPIIADASRRFGVPENRIRAVMGVESGGRADAVSPKGAAGLMQVMAPTYADLAKRHGFGPDRFDPTNNIMAGTAYLGETRTAQLREALTILREITDPYQATDWRSKHNRG